MLRVLMQKMDNMHEHMDNESRKMEVLTKYQKKILEMKTSVTEMDMAKELISELEDMSIETSKAAMQREKTIN